MRKEIKYLWSLCLALAGSVSVSADAHAENWVNSRAVMSGACHVQKETSRPYIGELLPGTYPDEKSACQKAKDLNTDDADDKQKCFTYTKGATSSCKKAGVQLP